MKNYQTIAAAILLGSTAMAQQNTNGEVIIAKAILPNGKELKDDNIDSLKNAWGADRILYLKSVDENHNTIMRVVRKTDEQAQKEAADRKALNDLVGRTAPQFELTDLNGKKWLSKMLRGKVVVLNFWFTSCMPCVREIPELNKLTEEYKPEDVVFLAIAPNTAEQLNAFLKKREFKYTVLPDSKGVDKIFKISSWPTSMVIDKKGIIRFVQVSSQDIHARLKAAISEAQ